MGGHRPKSLTLIILWDDHRAALQYDWLHAWHTPLDLTQTPLFEAWPMLKEILKNRSSHCWAALAGWSYIPDPADKLIHAINQSNVKNRRLTPQWEKPDPLTTPKPRAKPTPKRNPKLRGRLMERLGIHD